MSGLFEGLPLKCSARFVSFQRRFRSPLASFVATFADFSFPSLLLMHHFMKQFAVRYFHTYLRMSHNDSVIWNCVQYFEFKNCLSANRAFRLGSLKHDLVFTNWMVISRVENFFNQMKTDFTMWKFISPLENTHSPNDRFHEVNFCKVISPRCLHPNWIARIRSFKTT